VRDRAGTVDQNLIPANAQHRYEVRREDIPLSCPMPGMYLWNSHPKVYLPIEETVLKIINQPRNTGNGTQTGSAMKSSQIQSTSDNQKQKKQLISANCFDKHQFEANSNHTKKAFNARRRHNA
jgi:uncharacterized Zn-finger protein